ncbi:MAG: biopolymer transporter ExbD [Planctomycetales bacterium]|nr:biopolymer transporter ExbD [Planctomycetales bacterium]NIM10152.1 biopolymer transporter ExbD [Planctomycetales bacterium]NIN09578.1 biopolymer transporter ExbD [Planctomycetales bacterium]NIN78701.1 biopolymer transporter ExbD [Planctomycetales bacterium]NIO35878.1 biopolymer transporter ExbD [Planctomycetales bacterium]
MRIPVSRRLTRLEMNMTPMIDVVFLLIIFFLVSSHLAQQEVQAELDLPTATTGADSPATNSPRVTINVVPVRGEPSLRLGDLPVDRNELRRRLANELAAASQDLEVRIRADRGTPYETVEPILVTCAQLGIWNVQFAVVRPDPP